MNRRDLLLSSSATALALVSPRIGGTVDGKSGHVTLQAGELTAVIGENSAVDGHCAGYNGVWSRFKVRTVLRPRFPRSEVLEEFAKWKEGL